MKIAIATCRRKPEPDPDQGPLLRELRSLGAEARALAWDEPSAPWGDYDLCVIRSTWNYIHHLPEFLAWAKRCARKTKLLNPPEIVRWNTDKIYLKELEARGVPVVPSHWCPRGKAVSLLKVCSERGWTDVVIKPRIGAGSYATHRFTGPSLAAGELHLNRLLRERDMMVQPYLRSVETRGERALVWIAGELTHAIRKSPRLSGQNERVSRVVSIAARERAFARKALQPYARELLYARVDVAPDQDGELRIMELELVEPSLFLLQHPPALKRFARSCLDAA